jgi:hypothetical protein
MKLLGNLCGVMGVRGAALYLPDGQCLESQMPAPYEPGYVFDILQQLLRAFEATAFVDNSPLRFLYGRLADGIVAIGKNPRYRVVALAEPTVNLMMVNVALGALNNRIIRDGGLSLTQSAQDPPSVTSTGNISQVDPFTPRHRMANVIHQGAAPAQPQSISDFTLNSEQLRAVAPADVVPLDVMRVLLKATAQAVGPMAKPLLKREITRRGFTTSTLPWDELPHVASRIAARIEREDMRRAFEAAVARITR